MTEATPLTEQDRRLARPSHSVRVVAAHAKLSAAVELQYRANFWAYLVNTVVTLGVSLASLALVYSHVEQLNGWSVNELLVVLGVFFMLGAFIFGSLHPSATNLVQDVRMGDFDFRLLKPVSAQLMGAAQTVDGWKMFDLLVGLALVVVGLVREGAAVTVAEIFVAIVMLVVAMLIAAAFWTLACTLTFWTIQGQGILWALDDMYDHLRWPLQVFSPGLRLMLSTIFPIGLAVTVPAQAITGRLTLEGALAAFGVCAVLVISSRLAWRKALRRYEGASS